MLLALDIGNTNIVIGAFKGEELIFELRLKTDTGKTIDEFSVLILALIQQRLKEPVQVDRAIISSVVPPITGALVEVVKSCFGVDPLVVGPGIKTGIRIKITDPSTLGADRIVNAVAARELYGCPALVVDFGTATTFDFVSADGAYEGGIIAPGVAVAMESLVRNTAKLPRIELQWPASVIGKSTVAAMQSGTVIGYTAMVDGLIDRVVAEVGQIPNVIATGGLGRLFSEHSKRLQKYDPYLTLKGMRIVADLNR